MHAGPAWEADHHRFARRSGIAKADGFALNVANFYATDQVLDHGHRVSAALEGAHFVVDTGRNGRGRADGDTVAGGPAYCNPPGRGLGAPLTTATGDAAVDTHLWIKWPSDSDGDCRPGEPAAGQWWPDPHGQGPDRHGPGMRGAVT